MKNLKKLWAMLLAACMISGILAGTASADPVDPTFNGWFNQNGTWYYLDSTMFSDGTYSDPGMLSDGTFEINGSMYTFDANGAWVG